MAGKGGGGGRPSGGGGGGFKGGGSSSHSSRPSVGGGSKINHSAPSSFSSGSRPSNPTPPRGPMAPPPPRGHMPPPPPPHGFMPPPPRRRYRSGSGFFTGYMVGNMMHGNRNNGNTYVTNNYYDANGNPIDPNYAQSQNIPAYGACEYCGATYQAGERNCPKCGASLPAIPTNQTAYNNNPQSGYNTSAQAGYYQQPVKRKKNNAVIWVVCIIIALVAIIGISSCLNNGNEAPELKTYTYAVGQTVKTPWFDFKVEQYDLKTTADYPMVKSFGSSEKYVFVVDIMIKNTYGEEMVFYDTDFLLAVSSDLVRDDYLDPIIDEELYAVFDTATYKVFRFDGANEFTLGARETLRGRLIFTADKDTRAAGLNYTEFEANEYNNEQIEGDSHQVILF